MTPEEQKALEAMVKNQIEARGVKNKRVLKAMRRVPRAAFMPKEQRPYATYDGPLPIGEDQTISQPYIVAAMTEALLKEHNEEPPKSVLEIGTGSGYQTAVLAEIFERVYTIERIESLSQKAQSVLKSLNYANIHFRIGNGFDGWPDHAPYEAVIVTAAPPSIPPALLEQLAIGGRMVIPVGERFDQRLLKITRTAEGYDQEEFFGVRFVAMVNKK